MARKIIDLVREKKAVIERDPDEAERNATKAVAAILGGINSPEWRTYMLQFVDKDAQGQPLDPRQLARLLGQDATAGNADRDRNRAYLASNGTCGAESPGALGFDFTVASIDEGLDDPCPVVQNQAELFGSKQP